MRLALWMTFSAWTWIVPPTVATVGQAVDGISTYRSTHGMTRVACVESNSLYGSGQPSAGRIVAVKAMPVLSSWIVAAMARRYPQSKTVRVVNWVTGGVVGAAGVVPGIHNIATCGW